MSASQSVAPQGRRWQQNNKQGNPVTGKWRSLAGLLPGGGLKAGPPPAINHLPFSIAQGAGARGDGRATARPECAESVIFVVREQYGVGLRPSFSSGDSYTRLPTLVLRNFAIIL